MPSRTNTTTPAASPPPTRTRPASHYAALSLPPVPHAPLPPDLRARYRAALLAAHPDKKRGGAGADLDAVRLAFHTLSDPARRRAYDDALARHAASASSPGGAAGVQAPGAGAGEEVDLDAFAYRAAREGEGAGGAEGEEGGEAEEGVYVRACGRCGAEEGFVVAEGELEGAVVAAGGAGWGEVAVQCAGCSLWVRVGFGVGVEGGEGEGVEGAGGGG